LSGTITRIIHVVVKEGETVVAERNKTVVITFDGTQFATMTVGDSTWQVDLSQRGVRGRFRKQGKNGK
jgi:hypothetical protein